MDKKKTKPPSMGQKVYDGVLFFMANFSLAGMAIALWEKDIAWAVGSGFMGVWVIGCIMADYMSELVKLSRK